MTEARSFLAVGAPLAALVLAVLAVSVEAVTHPPPLNGLLAPPRFAQDAARQKRWTSGPPSSPSELLQRLQQLQQLSRQHVDNYLAALMSRQLLLQAQPSQQPEQAPAQDPRPQQPQPTTDSTPVSTVQAPGTPGPRPALPVVTSTTLAVSASSEPSPPEQKQTEPVANEVDDASAPSKCVWAIVTCCQPQTSDVRYSCFELLGCPGSFWDNSPCDPTVTSHALVRVAKFFAKGSDRAAPVS